MKLASLWAVLLLLITAVLWLGGCSSSTEPEEPDPVPMIETYAGTGTAGWDGGDKPLLESHLYWPVDLTMTSIGLLILDWNNHLIRQVTPQNTLRTIMGVPNEFGDGDLGEQDRNYPGVPATTIRLNHPTDIIEQLDGTLLITCWHNHKLRVYDTVTELAYVMCGDSAGFVDDGPAKTALMSQPTQTVQADDGTLYTVDQRNVRVRKITPNGDISTVVGTGEPGFFGDGDDPALAKLNFGDPGNANPPVRGALALDAQGRLYISDTLNHRIRRVDFGRNIIETVVGDGTAGYSGDGGDPLAASINNPRDMEFGPDGRLYFVDELNHRIRVVDLDAKMITTYAGNGVAGFSGDGGPATAASLNSPGGIEFDQAGNLYIADAFNHRIRRVVP